MKNSTGSSEGNNTFPLHTFTTLAKRWGVSSQTVVNWSNRHNDFPKATIGYVSSDLETKFFALCDVEVYEKRRGLNKTLDK